MELTLTEKIEIEKLKHSIEKVFPEYNVKNALFNKSTIRITKGTSQVVVGQLKNQKMICVGNLNMLDLRILIPFAVGMTLFLITGFIFLIVMMQIKKKEYKAMEEAIGAHLQNTYVQP
ncbi:hypothetical protein [uncultured Dokdonia sp.]|uniref:hypothetical protein n=1 Tax=uncultured Dokdonia sp. TaxID=575653 RepID=UPI00261EA5E2|nr:hypothetical protein [uncultured Dokdonia sp.]